MSALPVSELIKMTNGIPWEICCIAMVGLQEGLDVPTETIKREMLRWQEGGAVPNDHGVIWRWLLRDRCYSCGRLGEIFLSSNGFSSCRCKLPRRVVN